MGDRLLALPEVKKKTSLGTTWIYELIKLGKFPKGIKLSDRCVRWRESEIDTWIASLEAKAS
jgi:prophage regulatory protein